MKFTHSTHTLYPKAAPALFYSKNYPMTIIDDGGGFYSIQKDDEMMDPTATSAISTTGVEVYFNTMYTIIVGDPITRQYKVEKNGDNFSLIQEFQSANPVNIVCAKDFILANPASDLTVSLVLADATLNWTDNSVTEGGFNVMRKDALEGPYVLLSTEAIDTTTYVDTALTNGTYWYRVHSSPSSSTNLSYLPPPAIAKPLLTNSKAVLL